MHNTLPKIFCFIKNYEENYIKRIPKNIGIIYRNYNKIINNNEIKKINNLCKKTKKKFFLANNIKIALQLDLDCIINFQSYWRNKILITKNQKIIKNIKKIVNFTDPITMEVIFRDNKFNYNVDKLFPIIRNNKMYLYIIDSLNEYIKNTPKEIYTNTKFTKKEINEIKKNYIKIYKTKSNNIELTDYFRKIKILKKFDMIGTYFPISDYNKIVNSKFKLIYNELKNMWTTFKNDNNINENEYFGTSINWPISSTKYERLLLNKINILLNEDLDKNIQIMISYVIIGAFAYVCPHIKKYYDNLIFD